ncbi:MAG: alanine racemase [Bacteroidaceae bacterium]|nr:alanine racemase [Bacteroidaceae bacterium]
MEVKVDQIEKRSWVEVDLGQIEKNYNMYKASLPKDVDIMAVIKADAYGHGDVKVATLLSSLGVKLFAVSNIDEAVGLRNAGINGEILILGYSSPIYARTLYYLGLTQAIVSEEYALALAKTGYEIKCQFAVDTGMNRIGILSGDAEEAASIIREYSTKLNVTGIFTHLCVADGSNEDDRNFTLDQLQRFKAVVDKIDCLHLPYIHCYNSAGGLYHLTDNSLNQSIGNIVRLGIALYGLKPDRDNKLPEGIKPAMAWKSVISRVQKLPEGATVSYGRTFTTKRPSLIATVTTGYADGYNRHLSNRGFVMIKGHKAPIVGRICMDQTMVDVTDIPGVKMSDVVVLMGECGNQNYTADDMAADLDTIGYEVICNISKRVQRFYPKTVIRKNK